MKVKTIYKLLPAAEWEAAWAEGVYRGSEQDRRDGFIHLSTAAQIAETARKHFSGVPDLVLLAVDTDMIEKLHAPENEGEQAAQSEGGPLRWEPSRGGDLFPHLYAPLPSASVQSATPAPLAGDGTPVIPHDLPS
jgi:uncharacterized protein (DUF952 family)